MTGDWRDEAACVFIDTEVFFPHPSDREGVAAAKRVCDRCPVAEACALYAVETGTRDGIWGGLGYTARKALEKLTTQAETEAGAADRVGVVS